MSSHGASPPPSRSRTVRCPACSGPSLYAPENRFRPFCCERCKLHDLGAWASESFRIEAEPNQDIDATPPDSRVQ
jgi:endogenous inhibitor of DNA gyrase (YacG/DUF329 family)